FAKRGERGRKPSTRRHVGPSGWRTSPSFYAPRERRCLRPLATIFERSSRTTSRPTQTGAGSLTQMPSCARSADRRLAHPWRRVGEGIAGWVASRGERVVLMGPVDDDRFRGSDPQAGESVIMPLRAGDEIIGVLNVKRPTGGEGFGQKLEVLDAIAGDVGRALVA